MEWTILHRFGLAGTNGHQFIKRRNPNVEIRIDDQSQSSKHGFFSRNFRSSGRNRTSVEASAKALDAATVLIPPAKRLRLQLETRKLSGEFRVHQFANLSHRSVAVGGSLITDHQFTGNQGAATSARDQLSAMDYQLSAFVPQARDYGGQVSSSDDYGRGAGVGRGRGVGVGLGVTLGVPVGVGVELPGAVAVGVAVGVCVAVGVGVGVRVAVGVAVGVTIAVAVGVGVGVRVAVGVAVGVTIDVAVGVAVGVRVAVGVAVAVAVA